MTGYVYFIQGEDGGPIKIGWSESPEDRLSALQTGYPARLVLLGTIPGERALEGKTHRRFRHLRLHNEWFRPAADLVRFIGSGRESDQSADDRDIVWLVSFLAKAGSLEDLRRLARLGRSLLGQRTKLGLEAARRAGKRLGRPPVARPPAAEVRRRRHAGETWEAVAEGLACSVWAARMAVANDDTQVPTQDNTGTA